MSQDLTEHEQTSTAESATAPVTLSYFYNGMQFRIRASGGDVDARTKALDGVYEKMRDFGNAFEHDIHPKSGIDDHGDLLCSLRQSSGAAPEIMLEFRLNPELTAGQRKHVEEKMKH